VEELLTAVKGHSLCNKLKSDPILQSNCDSNSDCADNECCVAMDRYFIVSRRDLMPMPVGELLHNLRLYNLGCS